MSKLKFVRRNENRETEVEVMGTALVHTRSPDLFTLRTRIEIENAVISGTEKHFQLLLGA